MNQGLVLRIAAPLIATQAMVWMTVAVFLLVRPGFLATVFYTAPLDDTGLIVARLFGAELAGLALASWVTRPTASAVRPRPLFASYFACNFLGFLISAGASMRGATTATGWMLVFLYFFYAGAFAALWLKAPRRAGAGPLVERMAAAADRR